MEIFFTQKIPVPNQREIQEFLQQIANSLMQGHCRYGAPDKRKKYMTRAFMELKAYKKTGNWEHFRNAAVYAGLEKIAPEHPKFHYDQYAKSATRGKI